MKDHSPLIEASGLGRRHPRGDQWLLADVDFRLQPGDTWAFSGPSGAGKTLLLRSLAWLDPIDAGELRWNGKRVFDGWVPRYRSQVVYLHQRPAFMARTVNAELQIPYSLALHRHRQFDAHRVTAWLGQLGRDADLLERPCSELSGGERQMVALLRVIQLEPQVLLLDEPTAALDADAATALESLVTSWIGEQPERRAYIWVTHNADQSQRLCQHTLRLDAGRVQEIVKNQEVNDK